MTASTATTAAQDAAVLAARCALHLRTIARTGGPDVESHLERLRRLLVRRQPRASLARRRQIAHAVSVAGTGRPGAVADADRAVLVADLRAIEHALATAARIGVAREPAPPAVAAG